MSEYAGGTNNNEHHQYMLREREQLLDYSPEQRQSMKDALLAEISDRERIVHMISSMEEDPQDKLF